jgi:hypothetical protein
MTYPFYLFLTQIIVNTESGAFSGPSRARALSSPPASSVASTMPFTLAPPHPVRVYSSAECKQVSISVPSSLIYVSSRPILIACLYLCHLRLIATQPYPSRLWTDTAWGIIVLLMCVIISLTAQGTANFFSPSTPPDAIRSSLDILKASLILLLFSNISFLGILGLYHRRCSTAKVFHESTKRRVKIVVFTLYASGLLILVRNIFRTVQIFSPSYSLAWNTEAFFWAFDASPLLICMLLLNTLHPGKLVLVGEENTLHSG